MIAKQKGCIQKSCVYLNTFSKQLENISGEIKPVKKRTKWEYYNQKNTITDIKTSEDGLKGRMEVRKKRNSKL